MKVIPFKLFNYQAVSISELINLHGVYANTSECIRIASLECLNDLLLPTEDEKNALTENKLEIPELSMGSSDQTKKAISCKFPKRILIIIDNLVKKSDKVFKSRTDFFRFAVERLIHEDSQLFLNNIIDKDDLEVRDDKELSIEERNNLGKVTPLVVRY